MNYIKLYEVVKRVSSETSKPEWLVRKRMKPPFLGTYKVFKSKKEAEQVCLADNNAFNGVI